VAGLIDAVSEQRQQTTSPLIVQQQLRSFGNI
jgi:hypothetical protein